MYVGTSISVGAGQKKKAVSEAAVHGNGRSPNEIGWRTGVLQTDWPCNLPFSEVGGIPIEGFPPRLLSGRAGEGQDTGGRSRPVQGGITHVRGSLPHVRTHIRTYVRTYYAGNSAPLLLLFSPPHPGYPV